MILAATCPVVQDKIKVVAAALWLIVAFELKYIARALSRFAHWIGSISLSQAIGP
jgi:hypothetical protein